VADNTKKILGQFNLSAIPSLPELLLAEMDALQDSADTLQNLVNDDLFLFLRLLDGSPVSTDNRNFDPREFLHHSGPQKLATVIRQSAARMGFARLSPQRLLFLKQLHLQSLLARSLAEQIASSTIDESPVKQLLIRQAGFCGMLLNLGALVLEQVFPVRYLELLQESSSTAQLLEAEVSEFGTDHARLGAALLEHFQVGGFCQDAVRFHHASIEEILDATPLVRIAWLANQLADEKEKSEAAAWADQLFTISEESLVQIRAVAQEKLGSTSDSLGIQFTTTRYLPLPAPEDEKIQKHERKSFRKLRDRLEADNLLDTLGDDLEQAKNTEAFGSAMDSSIRLLFGPINTLLFTPDEDNHLQCSVATLADIDVSQLRIRCEAERSQITRCFLNNEELFRLDQENMTVVDRQVMAVLGTDNFCCEPVPGRKGVAGVLVLGVPMHRSDNYKKQVYIRRAFLRKLGSRLTGSDTESNGTNLDVVENFNRRIRETIHEVNNPLGIIKNYLQLLSMKQEDDSKTQSEISFIKSEIDRVAGILEKLKDEPGSNSTEGGIDVNRIVTGLSKLITGSIDEEKNISIDTTLDSDLPEIQSNENTLKQILTNLVKNAAEACEENGEIQIKTAGNIYMNGNRYIQISVKDNGPGIPADILDNLYSPGNSSKGGEHTGSGLAIVSGLVDELGGQISCQTYNSSSSANNSQQQTGTEFSVLIPVAGISSSKENY